MINLNRFVKTETTILPLVSWSGVYNGRRLYFNKFKTPDAIIGTGDGWFEVEIGEKLIVNKPASPLQIRKALKEKKGYRFYVLGSDGIPIGKTESIPIHNLSARPFEVVEAVEWEGTGWYFKNIDTRFQREVRGKVREAFEKEQPLDGIKHIVPELRYIYVVLNLQRQSIRQVEELKKFALAEKEKAKRVAEFQSTFSGRLKLSIENAGGVLVKFTNRGTGWLVEWRIKDNPQPIKSIINDSLGIISAGYCIQGKYDSAHSMSSAIQLAKIFDKDDVLNITRI